MDTKKDIQKTENISRFVEKQTLRSHPFGDNKMGEKAYRRAERLVAAIHLLTNHLDSQEPLRRTIRESAVNMLMQTLELRDEMRTIGSQKTVSVEVSIRHLISLTRILAVAGYVSFENADVLTDGLDDLAYFIETSKRSSLSESVRLSREEMLNNVFEERQPFIKDIKDRVSTVKDKTDFNRTDSINAGSALNKRMQAIVEVLRNGTDFGIKEIGLNIPEYSEKMIQRELSELVSQGFVTKTGLRRWSRYTLAPKEADPAAGQSAPASDEDPSDPLTPLR